MRVLIVGAGATGGYFGGRLVQAARDVTFLVRPRRRAQLLADGLVIASPLGDARLSVSTVLAEEIRTAWDLLIIACKAYDLDGAIDAVARAVGPETMILPLLNGMRHLDVLVERFGAQRVLGGLCSIAATVDERGTIRHLNDLQIITFGERDGGESPRTRAIAELFTPTALKWKLSPNVLQEMWEKWVFLSTLAGGTCLFRGSIGEIVAAGGAPTMEALLAEAQSVAVAAGFASRPAALEWSHNLVTAAGSPLTASMLRDVEKGGPVEADHVIGDLLRRGQAAGLSMPLMAIAHLHLETYEARRQRPVAAATQA